MGRRKGGHEIVKKFLLVLTLTLIGVFYLTNAVCGETGFSSTLFIGDSYSEGTDIELQKHTLDLGTEISYIKYEEPDVMEEEGMMYGIVGSYTYHNRLMLKAEGKFSYGWVDYSSADTGSMDDLDDYMLEFRGLGGWDFLVWDDDITSTYITPYIGIGYRYLNDDLTGTSSTGARGYERESNYLYSPIGIEATITELENNWTVGAMVEYDLFWYGVQRSHLGDFFAGLDTMDNDQHEGWGIRGSIKIQKEWEKIGLIIEPFIRYWDIEKSDEESITYSGTPIGLVGYEPKNNSMEIGGKLAVIF